MVAAVETRRKARCRRGTGLDSRERARLAAAAAEEKKAREIEVLELGEVTVIADYFVICSGQSSIQVRAIADAVREKMTEAGHGLLHWEGYENGRWVLLDFGDVIVHVFLEEERKYYDIERLWRDARRWEPADASPAQAYGTQPKRRFGGMGAPGAS